MWYLLSSEVKIYLQCVGGWVGGGRVSWTQRASNFTWYSTDGRMNAALWRDVTDLKRQLAIIQAETKRSHCDVSQWQEVIACKNFTSHCPDQLDVIIRYITYKIYRQTLPWQNMLHVGTTRQNLQPTKATYTPVATISWPRASSAQISGHIHVTTCIHQRLYDQRTRHNVKKAYM